MIPVERLLSRGRPTSREDDLARLAARFAVQPSRLFAPREALRLARRMGALKRTLADRFASVESCRGCARGEPLPKGRWEGGRCCATSTLVVFSTLEVAALKLSGVAKGDLAPPAADHAGCAFRGPRGCSLRPEQRPSMCLLYVCADLAPELVERDDAEEVNALRVELRAAREAFGRAVGVEDDAPAWLAPADHATAR